MNIVVALHNALDGAEGFWLALTLLGRDEVYIVVLALYAWLINPVGMRALGVAFSVSYLVNTALKYGLNLGRPFLERPDVASDAARATAGGSGFPSGHAQITATLWLGMAWQLWAQRRARWVWWVAGTVTLLVALSRLVLGVHYPLDVLAGLLLGLIFAGLALASLPLTLAWKWGVPLLALLVAVFVPATAPREYAVGLGLLAGFWLLQVPFHAPQGPGVKLLVAVVGLIVVFAVYFGLSAVLPAAVRDAGLGRALRYALLVLVAGEGVPRIFGRWMLQRSEASSGEDRSVRL